MSETKDEYWAKGYAVFRRIFKPDEMHAAASEVQRLWNLPGLLDDLNLRTEFRKGLDGAPVLDRLDPVLDISPLLKQVTLHTRLLNALKQLFGERPALLKCKLIRKDPGTSGYLHHQDFLYWRWLDAHPDRLCSVGICIHESNSLSGGIEMFPRLHGRLWPGPGGDPEADLDQEHIDFSQGEIPDLAAGDVIVFHSLTPHRSGPNNSSTARTLLLPSYIVGGQGHYERYYRREVQRRLQVSEGFEGFHHKLARVDAEVRASIEAG